MPHPTASRIALAALALLALAPIAIRADELESGFLNPPDSAKPRTWWHWVSGNVSKEGITADLEAMKSIGLAGAQIFTVDQSDVKGPVVFMSPEWRGLVHHALSEADRLGLEMTLENCEGWSESGGPWVTPEQSMQKVVWTEAAFQGGQRITLSLPQPLIVRGTYADVALFAFPTIRGDAPLRPLSVTTPTGPVGADVFLPHPTPEKPQWVLLDFGRPAAFSTLRIATAKAPRGQLPGAPKWELQCGVDGRSFRKVCDVPLTGTTEFPEAIGRYFRLWVPDLSPKDPSVTFVEIALSGPRIDAVDDQTGIAVHNTFHEFSTARFPISNIIPSGGILDLTGRATWDAPPGDWTLVRIGHTSTGKTNYPASPATAGLECDKLSAAAVTAHFEKGMLGSVILDSGPLAGKSLRYVLCDSWEAGCENWTPLIRDEFRKRRGYDPEPWLLTLTGRVVGSQEDTERFLWDYRRTLADLVAENHYGVLQRLAHENHMGLYAEAVGINMPTVADQLQCKGFTDVPMGEFWVGLRWPGLTPDDDAKEAASAAHIYGKPIAAAESYTAFPQFSDWAQDPYSLKALGDYEFCLGINRFVFHRYAHQPWLDRKPGMSMGPWGTNFERTNTWWQPAAAWMSYLSRCQFLLQQGVFAADICYYYGEGAPVDLNTAALTPKPPSGFDFDVCNTEILLRMSVKDGRIVLPGGMTYRVLVLPDSDRMTVSVATKIRDLVKAGARVVGRRPTRSPSLAGYPACDETIRAIAAEIWGNCDGRAVTTHSFGAGRVSWGRPLDEVLGIQPDFSSSVAGLRYIHRRADGAEIYFVSNQESRDAMARCTFRVASGVPEIWHPDTGRMETAALYYARNDWTTVPLRFDPSGSLFVIFRRGKPPADPITALGEASEIFPRSPDEAGAPLPDGPVFRDGHIVFTAWKNASYWFDAADVALPSRNVSVPPRVRVDGPWTVVFPPGLGAPPLAVFDRLVSWTGSMEAGIRYFSGTATYRKEVNLPGRLFGLGLHQFLDLGSVKNLARVRVNGKDLGVLWKEPFRVEVTGAAKPGENQLEVEVTNLWPNRMIGDQAQPAAKRITWASVSPYTETSPLLPSGLLGPVVIRAARDVIIR